MELAIKGFDKMDKRKRAVFMRKMREIKMRLFLFLAAAGGFGLGFGITGAVEKLADMNVNLSVLVTTGSLTGMAGFVIGSFLLLRFS